MDEHVKDAIRHERELREQDIEQLEKCITNMRDHHAKSVKGIKDELKSIAKWDKFQRVGYILVGIFLTTFPELVPIVKQLMTIK